jgi:hypothetical protein
VSPGRTVPDAAAHLLTVHVVVDLPPGLPLQARLLPSSAGETNLRPLVGATPWLRPDYSGQIGYTVRFAVPVGPACLGGGPFVALDVEAKVGSGADTRLVRFALAALLPQAQLEEACSG